jgi:hypothetical protein
MPFEFGDDGSMRRFVIALGLLAFLAGCISHDEIALMKQSSPNLEPDPSSPMPARSHIYGASGPVRVEIKAMGDAWVQVRDANQAVLLMRVLHSGDTFRVLDRVGLTLRTGNAGGLMILVDGKEVPSVGPIGGTGTVSLDPDRLIAGHATLDVPLMKRSSPNLEPDPSTPIPARSRVYGVNGPVRVEIKAVGDAWVQVRDANQSVLQMRVLHSGDTLRVPDRVGLTLRTGNAGGLKILVDGEEVPRVGPIGRTGTVSLDPERLIAGHATLN